MDKGQRMQWEVDIAEKRNTIRADQEKMKLEIRRYLKNAVKDRIFVNSLCKNSKLMIQALNCTTAVGCSGNKQKQIFKHDSETEL